MLHEVSRKGIDEEIGQSQDESDEFVWLRVNLIEGWRLLRSFRNRCKFSQDLHC